MIIRHLEGLIGDRMDAESFARISELVAARLAKGAEEYGAEGFADRTLGELEREVEEEAVDVLGWLCTAIEKAERDLVLTSPRRDAYKLAAVLAVTILLTIEPLEFVPLAD